MIPYQCEKVYTMLPGGCCDRPRFGRFARLMEERQIAETLGFASIAIASSWGMLEREKPQCVAGKDHALVGVRYGQRIDKAEMVSDIAEGPIGSE